MRAPRVVRGATEEARSRRTSIPKSNTSIPESNTRGLVRGPTAVFDPRC
jgi:hypothetical protein